MWLLKESIISLSTITENEILNSKIFYEYLQEYLIVDEIKTHPIRQLVKKKIEVSSYIHILSAFPYVISLAFSSKVSPDVIDFVTVETETYNDTDIEDLQFQNKMLILKSQYHNIVIY